MKRCRNCLRKEKVFLVDLNLINPKGKIRFKNCKKKIGQFCVVLMLDKIKIKL